MLTVEKKKIYVILDREISHNSKTKTKLLLIVNRKFDIFIF